jgi:HEAT repeat protein
LPYLSSQRIVAQPRGIPFLGGLYVSSLLLLLIPAIASSQYIPSSTATGLNSTDIRNRYDRNRRSSDIKEWVRRLQDEKPETRLDAVKHLGTSKHPDAIDSLIEATADPDIRVKVKAVDYLGDLRATDSIPILVQQLFLRDVDLGIKHRVLVALGKIGDPRAGEPIAEFLKRNLESDIRGSAIFALAETGGPEAIPSLQRVAEEVNDPRLQRLATTAVEEIRQRLSPVSVAVEPTYIMMERLRAEAEGKGKRR